MSSETLSGDDRALWERVSGGDRNAFADLFDRHARAVYNYAYRRTANWSVAEDVVATTFLEAWRKRAEFGPIGASLRPLLLGIATNVLRNLSRRRRRYESAIERLAGTRPSNAENDDEIVRRLDAEQATEVLSLAIGRLPRHQRDVVWLCFVEDLSYSEAAAALDVPIGTIRSRLSRASARLRGDATLEPFWSGGHDRSDGLDSIRGRQTCETD